MGFYDMMAGWGGWTMYLGMIVFWAAAVGLVVWGIRAALGPRAPQAAPQAARESAVDILARRYAAGEIDAAEFAQKKRDLA